MTADY